MFAATTKFFTRSQMWIATANVDVDLLRMQAFLTDTSMSSQRGQEKSVSIKRGSLQTSKLGKREQMKKNSCA